MRSVGLATSVIVSFLLFRSSIGKGLLPAESSKDEVEVNGSCREVDDAGTKVWRWTSGLPLAGS